MQFEKGMRVQKRRVGVLERAQEPRFGKVADVEEVDDGEQVTVLWDDGDTETYLDDKLKPL